MFKYLKEIFEYRELLISLTMRELKVRYKQTILGIAWAILQPLSMMIVFTVIFSLFAKIPSDGIPYPLFSYAGLLSWSFFATSLNFAIPSLVNNSNLITKIYFPREIFPLASVLAAFVDFSIAWVIFIPMLFFYGVQLTVNVFFVIPLIVLQIVFALAISLWASAINVRYRDVKYALTLVIQLWMFATPVVYPLSIVPGRYRFLYTLNPMTVIIDGYRRSLLHGVMPDLQYLGISAFISIGLLYLSYHFFKRVETVFADII